MTAPQHPTPPAPATSAPQAPDPDAVRRSVRATFRFGLWMVLTLLLVGAPLPWGALALATTVVTVVMGVRAMRAHRRATTGSGLGAAIIVGLVLTGLLGMESVGRIVTWDAQIALQECQAGAITVQAADACLSAHESDLEDLVGRFGPTRVTDAP